jgi:hypothetical protein
VHLRPLGRTLHELAPPLGFVVTPHFSLILSWVSRQVHFVPFFCPLVHLTVSGARYTGPYHRPYGGASAAAGGSRLFPSYFFLEWHPLSGTLSQHDARTTRSGLQWSPWELDGVASVVPELFQSKISLAPHLVQALALADLHAEALDPSMGDEDAWEDKPRILSHPPTPSSHPPSPLTPLLWSPSPPLCTDDSSVRSPSPLSSLSPSPPPSFQRRQSTGKKARRQCSRVAAAKSAAFGPLPKARHVQTHDQHHTMTTPTVFASVASNWSGPRTRKKKRTSIHHIRRLQALLRDDCDLIKWDGM